MNAKKFRGAVLRRKQATTTRKLDVQSVLQQLAVIRAQIPFLESAPRPVEDGRTRSSDGTPLYTVEDFEGAALEDAIEALADDLAAGIARKRAEMMEKAMKIYYIAEELARDPEHAHLIEHVEKMREAYEKEFGRPIPVKGE